MTDVTRWYDRKKNISIIHYTLHFPDWCGLNCPTAYRELHCCQLDEFFHLARIVYDVWKCDCVTGWWQIGPSSGTLTSSHCQYWPALYITHCSFYIGFTQGYPQPNITGFFSFFRRNWQFLFYSNKLNSQFHLAHFWLLLMMLLIWNWLLIKLWILSGNKNWKSLRRFCEKWDLSSGPYFWLKTINL